jgi:uncharacterized membrane protein YkgB
MEGSSMDGIHGIFESAARLDRVGISVTRIGPVVVLVWIGGLKAFRYEDEGIVPFVANSPFMSFFYRQPAGEYRRHMNREGEKDAIMMGAALVTTADSAKAYLRCRHAVPGSTTSREEAHVVV